MPSLHDFGLSTNHLGAGNVVVQAKMGVPCKPPPGQPTCIKTLPWHGQSLKVFKPGVDYRIHTDTAGKEYSNTIARMKGKKQYAISRGKYDEANDVEKAMGEIRKGKKPFAIFKNVIDGSEWGKWWKLENQTIIIKKVPPPGESWWDKVKGAVEWLGDAIVDGLEWVGEKFCSALSNPVFAAAVAYGSYAGVQAGAAAAGIPLDPATAKTIAALGVAGASAACMAAFPPPLPSIGDESIPEVPPAAGGGGTHPSTPPPKYPFGSLSRFNETRGVWSVYAPTVPLSGFGLAGFGVSAGRDVIPAPPEGFAFVGEEVGAEPPVGTQALGPEKDREWYHSWMLWTGLGLVAFGGLAFGMRALYRRRKQLKA